MSEEACAYSISLWIMIALRHVVCIKFTGQVFYFSLTMGSRVEWILEDGGSVSVTPDGPKIKRRAASSEVTDF